MRTCLLFTALHLCLLTSAQQVADSAFTYPIVHPAHPEGQGPVITLDEAHVNFHTLDGRYYPFGKLLASDGYQMRSGTESFSESILRNTKILVIANALHDDGEWVLPTLPAFTEAEVEAVRVWVENGGSLFLIADHMPFPGAAANLATAFGFEFINGFALRNDHGLERFSRTSGNLKSSMIANGRNDSERIDSIVFFTGQGFIAPPNAIVLSSLDTAYTILEPEVAWEFNETTPRRSGEGLVNGAALVYGKGRVVVIGEAAMFSAQVAGPQRSKAGMNHPMAVQNPQFLLNIIHWLDGLY